MQSTGYTRDIDNLGRITLPAPLRKAYGIQLGDRMEFFKTESGIMIRQYQPGCRGCGDTEIKLFGEHKLCEKCVAKLVREVNNSKSKP